MPGMLPPGMRKTISLTLVFQHLTTVLAPFPPNGAPGMPPNGFPPFPPNNSSDQNMNGPSANGPPPTFVPAANSASSSGPNIHPDRMRMLNGMQ